MCRLCSSDCAGNEEVCGSFDVSKRHGLCPWHVVVAASPMLSSTTTRASRLPDIRGGCCICQLGVWCRNLW